MKTASCTAASAHRLDPHVVQQHLSIRWIRTRWIRIDSSICSSAGPAPAGSALTAASAPSSICTQRHLFIRWICWIRIESGISTQRHLFIIRWIRWIGIDSGIPSAWTAASAHLLDPHYMESQTKSGFTCAQSLIFFPDFLDVWLSQHDALISRHSNRFTPKNQMNPFRCVLGTGRWLVFAIYCLLGGLVA